VTASNQNRVYGPTSYALGSQTTGFMTSGLVNSDSVSSVTLSGTAAATNAATGVGTLSGAITASAAAGSGLSNYAITYVAGNAAITQAALTVTADAQSRAYGVANPTLTYTATGLVNGDTLSGALTTNATNASGVGTYAITQGNLAASPNYSVTYNGANLTITQAALTVTADAQSRAYGATNPTLTYTATGLINGDTLTGTLATAATTTSPVGAYPITIGSVNNPNYTINYTGANLTVTQAALTVSAAAQSRAYGVANPALTYTTTGLVNGDTLTGSLATSATTASGVGIYAIGEGTLTASTNYALTYNGANLTVTAAPLTVTASNQSRVYGPTSYALGSQTTGFTTSGLVNSDSVSSVTLTGTAAATNAATSVGTLSGAITVSGAAGTGLGNYAISYIAGSATITQAALTVTADAQSRAYGVVNPALTYTTTGLVNGDTLTGALTTTATTASGVGTYAITQGSLAASPNYALTYNGANLTITQAALTVMADAQTRLYGDVNPSLTYTAIGLVNGDMLFGSLATAATVASPAGTYPISIGSVNNPNYMIAYTGANLTVTQMPSVTEAAQSELYNAANLAFAYTAVGLFNGDTLSGALTTSAISTFPIGTYTIGQGTLINATPFAVKKTMAKNGPSPCASGGQQPKSFNITAGGIPLAGGMSGNQSQSSCGAGK
jgi:hypothetical protein